MASDYLILGYFLIVLVYAFFKKTNIWDSFTIGIKEGTITVLNMFSYLLGFVFLVAILESCGIFQDLEKIFFLNSSLSPLIFIQTLLRPFSTASSYTIMLEIYSNNGPDSFSGVLSAFIHSLSDASIYIIGFFFTAAGIRKYPHAFWIGFLTNILGFILAFLFCKYFLF